MAKNVSFYFYFVGEWEVAEKTLRIQSPRAEV